MRAKRLKVLKSVQNRLRHVLLDVYSPVSPYILFIYSPTVTIVLLHSSLHSYPYLQYKREQSFAQPFLGSGVAFERGRCRYFYHFYIFHINVRASPPSASVDYSFTYFLHFYCHERSSPDGLLAVPTLFFFVCKRT